jgi:tRNA(Arg) A34 adenosine deaminase TadA
MQFDKHRCPTTQWLGDDARVRQPVFAHHDLSLPTGLCRSLGRQVTLGPNNLSLAGAGAILQARIGRLVYGARQPRLGADGSWVSLLPSVPPATPLSTPSREPSPSTAEAAVSVSEVDDPTGLMEMAAAVMPPRQSPQPQLQHPFHLQLDVTRGVCEEECAAVMRQFFRARRLQASTFSSSGTRKDATSVNEQQ